MEDTTERSSKPPKLVPDKGEWKSLEEFKERERKLPSHAAASDLKPVMETRDHKRSDKGSSVIPGAENVEKVSEKDRGSHIAQERIETKEEKIEVNPPREDASASLDSGITMRPFDWQKREEDITDEFDQFGETEHGLVERKSRVFSTKIEIYGHDRNNDRTCFRIEDFRPYCYFELPVLQKIKWNSTHEQIFKKWFDSRLGEGNGPVACKLVNKKRLYYFRNNKTYPMLLMSFRSETALKEAVKLCSRNIAFGLISIKLKPREHTLSPILKLIAMKKLKYSAWLKCKDFKKPVVPISSFKHEYIINWRSLELIPLVECQKWRTYPTVLSFDNECNAQNTKAMPKVKKRFDCTFMTGVTYYDSKTGVKKKYLIVLGKCEEIEDVEIIEIRYEKELIQLSANSLTVSIQTSSLVTTSLASITST
jgi:hypothetical protein